MQKVFAFTLLLLAVAFGQSRTTINYVNASTILGSITNIAGDPNALAPVIYALYVPENAGLFQLTLTNLNNADCSYVDYYLIADVAPCYANTFGLGSADRSFCNMYTNSYSGYYSVSTEAQPGQGSYYFKYQTGKYIYVGVGTESTYAGKVCAYSLQLEFNTTCAAGSVGTYTGDDVPTCFASTPAEISNFTTSGTNVNTTNFFRLWEFTVPVGTAYVSFTASSTEYFYIYGSSNNANSGYSAYDCYDSGNSVDGGYSTTLTCYTPESGKFYAYFELYSPNNDNFNFNFSSAIKVCPDNMIGENCEWPAQMVNVSNLTPINIVIPYNGSYSNYAFLYFDVLAGNTMTDTTQVNFYLNNVTGSEGVYSSVNKNTIAMDDTYRDSTQQQYFTSTESEYWVFSWQDWAVPSRLYIGFRCYNGLTGGNCNITVSYNSTSTTTGTTSGTTVSTSAATSTGTSTGTSASTSTGATSAATSTGTTISTTTSGTTTSGNVTIVTTSSASAIIATAALIVIAALF